MSVLKTLNFGVCLGIVLFILHYPSCIKQIVWYSSSTFLAIGLARWLMSFVRKFVLNPYISAKNKAVFITGCDSGFGYQLARRLDKKGFQVFAGCLNSLGEGAKSLQSLCSANLTIIDLDVTNNASVEKAKEIVVKKLGNNVLWAIVNNAGVANTGETEWCPLDDFERLHDINVMGTVRVTKAFLELLRKSKGRIINNTSVCAYLACPGYVAYCMSKSAAQAFTIGLRLELLKWGIRTISVEAFFYKTPIASEKVVLGVLEKTWEQAPEHIKEVYGEEYKASFKAATKRLLRRSSPHVHEVVDCFVDAVMSSDPMDSYVPSHFPHKIILLLFRCIPQPLIEICQWREMPTAIPADLKRAKFQLHEDSLTNGCSKME